MLKCVCEWQGVCDGVRGCSNVWMEEKDRVMEQLNAEVCWCWSVWKLKCVECWVKCVGFGKCVGVGWSTWVFEYVTIAQCEQLLYEKKKLSKKT